MHDQTTYFECIDDLSVQYLIVNLGMSRNFGYVDLEHLTFPATMKVDYIRVYQDANLKNVGCDPDDFPTAAYINEYAYSCSLSFSI